MHDIFMQRTEALVVQSIGGLSFPVHIDITLSDPVNAAVAEVLSRTGRIHCCRLWEEAGRAPARSSGRLN
jgi:hypothetical protein